MEKKLFAVVMLNSVTKSIAMSFPKESAMKVLPAKGDRPEIAIIGCQKIEDTTYGFLRLEPATEEKSQTQPMALSVPAHQVVCLLEAGEKEAAGFVAREEWPFPPNRE